MSKRSKGRRTTRRETSAGGVIFRRYAGGGPHVLLIRDAYSKWGLPKGHLEAGETAEMAALREIREETGLKDLRLGPHLQTIDWYFQIEGIRVHKYCHFYLVESPAGEALPQHEEGITECCWLPLGDALERISYVNARDVLLLAADELGCADPAER